MPIETNLNITPYYDDFDQDKDYYKVLFRPGVSVQTRELTQLQTILQNQIERFGDHVFKSGTIISGCNFQFIEKYDFVKVQDVQLDNQPIDLPGYLDLNVRNAANLVAKVINYKSGFSSRDPDTNYLYLRYLNSGNTGNLSSFSNTDVLTVYSDASIIFGVEIENGGTGFSNSDSVQFVSQLLVSFNVGTIGAGNLISQTIESSTANLEVLSVNTTFGTITLSSVNANGDPILDTYTDADYKILRVKPINNDLSNTSVTNSKWTVRSGYNILQGVSNTANVVAILGSGVSATLTTDSQGTINDISMITNGAGYVFEPYVTVRTGTGVLTNLNLNPRNYKAQVTVLDSTFVAGNTTPVGNAYAFSITEGIIYQKGLFLRVDPQTIIVNAYSSYVNNAVIGFDSTESIVNSSVDSSLLDNSLGTPNESAPGANRLKVTPTLVVVNTAAAAANNRFFPIVEFRDGFPFRQQQSTVYGTLAKEFERRTSETAGDFVIDEFLVSTKDKRTANVTHAELVVDPGKAYIDGKRLETNRNTVLDIRRGTDIAAVNNQTISLNYGNFVYVDEVSGYFNIRTGANVSLYDAPRNYLTTYPAALVGGIYSFEITDGGRGYTNASAVVITDATGTNASARIFTDSNGTINSIALSTTGANYSTSAQSYVSYGITEVVVADGGAGFTAGQILDFTGGAQLATTSTLTVDNTAVGFFEGGIILQGNTANIFASGIVQNIVNTTVMVVRQVVGTFEVTSTNADLSVSYVNTFTTFANVTAVADASASGKIGAVDAAGKILKIDITNPGIYTSTPTVRATGNVTSPRVGAAGTGYVNGYPIAILNDPTTVNGFSTANTALLVANVGTGGIITQVLTVSGGNSYVQNATSTPLTIIATTPLASVQVNKNTIGYSNTASSNGGVVYFTGNNMPNSYYIQTTSINNVAAWAANDVVSQGTGANIVYGVIGVLADVTATVNAFLIVSTTGPFITSNASPETYVRNQTKAANASIFAVANSHANAIVNTTATGILNDIIITPPWRKGHYYGKPLVEIGSQISSSVSIVSGGSGYAVSDPLVFTAQDGRGTGAAATVSSIGVGGTITGINITNRGSGYVVPPSITVTSTAGQRAVITCAVGKFNDAAAAAAGNPAVPAGTGAQISITIPSQATLQARPTNSSFRPLVGVPLANTPGNQIGTARVRSLVFDSGVPGLANATYRMYLYDIRMNPAKNFKQVRNISSTSGTIRGSADIITELEPSTGANGAILKNTSNSRLIFRTGAKAIKSTSSVDLVYRTTQTNALLTSNGEITVSVGGGDVIKYGSSTTLSPTQRQELIVVPLANAEHTVGVAVEVSTGSSELVGTGATSYFEVGDHVKVTAVNNAGLNNELFGTVISRTGTTRVRLNTAWPHDNTSGAYAVKHYPANFPIPMLSPAVSANTSGDGTSMTIKIANSVSIAANSTTYVTFDVKRPSAAPVAKQIKRGVLVKLSMANNSAGDDGPWSLGIPDVFRINGVYLGTNSSVNTSSTNVTRYFYGLSGQKDDYYDIAHLIKKDNAGVAISNTSWLLVDLDCFTTSTAGYYSAGSYTLSNTGTRASLGNTAINPLEIPDYQDPSGQLYVLSDAIDFRPYAVATANITSTIADASVNPSNTLTFSASDKLFPLPDSEFEFNYERYLPRMDRVIVDTNGVITNVEGIAATDGSLIPPPLPTGMNGVNSGAITVTTVIVPPFPTIAQQASNTNIEFMSRNVFTDKPSLKRIRDFQFSPENVKRVTSFFQPRRYTMKDIGQLERRIEQIEFYTSLSQLEAKTNELFIPSSVDPYLNRHKNGFYIDTFNGYEGSDTSSSEYRVHVDYVSGWAEPEGATYNFQARLDYTDPNVIADIIKVSGELSEPGIINNEEATLMLPYQEVEVIRQDKFTSAISGAGYDVKYAGDYEIKPEEFRMRLTLEVRNTPEPPPPPPPSGGSSGGSSDCKIICAKLNEMGFFEDDINAADQLFGQQLREQHPHIFNGYLAWAQTVVDWMDGKGLGPRVIPFLTQEQHDKVSSYLTTKYVYKLARPWAEEMAFRMGVRKESSLAGKIIMGVGLPLCWVVGRMGFKPVQKSSKLRGYAVWGICTVLLATSVTAQLIEKVYKKAKTFFRK